MSRVGRHPAESAGLAGALALVGARALGVSDPDVIIALGVIFASVPAAVTWLVLLIRKPSARP